MARYEEWLALAERCADATGPSRRLDTEIYLTSDGDEDLRASVPPGVVRNVYTASSFETREFTASIDAIAALIKHGLPGWWISADLTPFNNESDVSARVQGPRWVRQDYEAKAKTPALALCAVFCRAKAEIARVEEAALAEKESANG